MTVRGQEGSSPDNPPLQVSITQKEEGRRKDSLICSVRSSLVPRLVAQAAMATVYLPLQPAVMMAVIRRHAPQSGTPLSGAAKNSRGPRRHRAVFLIRFRVWGGCLLALLSYIYAATAEFLGFSWPLPLDFSLLLWPQLQNKYQGWRK